MAKKQTASQRPEELLAQAAKTLKKQFSGMTSRTVATKLGISAGYWSKILSGIKEIPQKLLPKITKVLSMDPHAIAQLQKSILRTIEQEQLTPATGMSVETTSPESEVQGYRDLDRTDFWLLAEWYYLPILLAFDLEALEPSAIAIAARLNVPVAKADETIRRLVERGFLTLSPKGKLKRTDQNVRFPTGRSYADVRNYHRAVLKKAVEELADSKATENFEMRLISGLSVSGSSKKIAEARLILEEAIYRAANLLSDEPGTDEIFQINVQLFPLTRNPRKSGTK